MFQNGSEPGVDAMNDVVVSFGSQSVRRGPKARSAHSFQLMVAAPQDLLVFWRGVGVNFLPVHKLAVLHAWAGVNLPVIRLRDGDHAHWLEAASAPWRGFAKSRGAAHFKNNKTETQKVDTLMAMAAAYH